METLGVARKIAKSSFSIFVCQSSQRGFCHKCPKTPKSKTTHGIMGMSAGGSTDMLFETEKTMRVIAKDANGIPRAWGEGSTTEAAMRETQDAATDYIKR